jgi:uncharacterized membrane protein
MKRFEESTTIAVPASSVYSYVSDFTRHGEWSGHELQVTKTSDGPTQVGSTFSTVAKLFGTQRETSTITEMTPGTSFAWDSVGALGRAHHSFSLTEEGGATVVRKSAEIVEPKVLAKMTSWRLSKDIPKALASDLAKIKATLERGDAAEAHHPDNA